MSLSTPRVFVTQERTPEGWRYWAEVVVDLGQLDEQLLYSTQFYSCYRDARRDALEWIRRNISEPPLM